MTQNIEDIEVLYYIQKKLGFGKIILRKEEHRNVGVFYVTSKSDFTKLVHIFNGNLCSNHKFDQFKLWLNVFNKYYKENIIWIDWLVIPSLKTAWLSGFVDAEGHFGGRVKYCRTSILKRAPHLALTIGQKEYYILSKIRNIFINNNKYISYDKSWDGWRLHIASFKILILVRKYFEMHPLISKKNKAYLRFINLHSKILNKEHLTIKGINEIEKLMTLINKS